MLAKTVAGIIVQYINISNQHTAHFKLTMLHVNLKKVERKKKRSPWFHEPCSIKNLAPSLELEGVTNVGGQSLPVRYQIPFLGAEGTLSFWPHLPRGEFHES